MLPRMKLASSSIAMTILMTGGLRAAPASFEERVRAAEALGRVDYRHRLWPVANASPKPAFEDAVPRSAIERKVRLDLAREDALERFWGRPVTSAQVQAELERMVRDSKDPDVLREYIEALASDARLVAECLARPVLVERLLTSFYAHDDRFHGPARREAEALRGRMTASNAAAVGRDRYHAVDLRARHDEAPDALASALPADDFSAVAKRFPAEGEVSAVEETDDAFLIRVTTRKNADAVQGGVVAVPKRPLGEWLQSLPPAPPLPARPGEGRYEIPKMSMGYPTSPDSWQPLWYVAEPRTGHTAIWTGSVMIVWGGITNGTYFLNTGGRYYPAIDSWFPIPLTGAPAARRNHSAVWTGSEMIVWGGDDASGTRADGASYDPVADTWTVLPSFGAPSARALHTAIWTGQDMIVWGGLNGGTYLGDGGRYSSFMGWVPVSTTGAPTGRCFHTAVWTGTEMVVWGGWAGGANYLNTGGRYNPSTGGWLAVTTTKAPSARRMHTAVWSGADVLIWGGEGAGPTNLGDGKAYSPTTNTWANASMSSINQPTARARHTAVWSGTEMIVWGGGTNTGGRYDPSQNSWYAGGTPTIGAPAARESHTAIWTGIEMIVWGGLAAGGETNTGGRYDPTATPPWLATSTGEAPVARRDHTAVWTGSEMIVWGGSSDETSVRNDGGRYNPAAAFWQPTNAATAPEARKSHTAVWTGSRMIVWGGKGSSVPIDTGGQYDPATDAWTATSLGPWPSMNHVAVWTGSVMAVWGGYGCTDPPICSKWGEVNSGGRYTPGSDTWSTMTTVGAPVPREKATAVYGGSPGKMVVFGGTAAGAPLNTGGRYVPSGDYWQSMSLAGAPSPRSGHSAVMTVGSCFWPPSGMLVFGGDLGTDDSNQTYAYYPDSDIWGGFSSMNAPPKRHDQVAVFTGTELLVWGGAQCAGACLGGETYLDTGGRLGPTYCGAPGAPGWLLTSAGTTSRAVTSNVARIDTVAAPGFAAGDTVSVDGLADATYNGTFTVKDVAGFGPPWFFTYALTHANEATTTDPGGKVGKTVPASPLSARSQATAVWTGESMVVWDGLPRSGSGAIFYPNTRPMSFPSMMTSKGLPFDFQLGVGETLTLMGSASMDGSNSQTVPTPLHDKFDSIAAYEWDIYPNYGPTPPPMTDCSLFSFTIDRTGSNVTLTESDLQSIGVSSPGNYGIVLRVHDMKDMVACQTMMLQVTDGQAPTVKVRVPNGGESWDYSPSTSSRRSHVITWDAADNFDITHTRVSYSVNGGGTWTCLADSTGSPCPATNKTGSDTLAASDTNFTWDMPTQAEEPAFPTALARIKVEAWDSSNNTGTDTSDSNFYVIQPTATAIQTLILWYPARIEAKYAGTSAALGAKLQALAGHNKVVGQVLDLSSVPAVASAYGAWDAQPTDASLANAVAAAIQSYVASQIASTYTNAHYLILVGDDFQIPFYRMVDGASFYSESKYPPEVGLNTTTTVGAAIAADRFLTDNYYSELSPEDTGLSAPHDKRYLNDLAPGRLVETPAQMQGVIDTFLAQDGQLTVTGPADKVLVAGFDFLYDSAYDIKQVFAATKSTDCLLDDPDAGGSTDFCLDKPYAPADLQAQVFSPAPHRIANVNTHANHFNWATSGGNLSTAAMDGDPDALTGTVLYTSGCHAGLPVPSIDSNPLDLPEEMAKKKVVSYVGSTGYGWGLRHGKGLTERLMEEMTAQIMDNGSISMGLALSGAKRKYLLQERRYDVFDEKVLHELTLFGIPNYLVVTKLAVAPGGKPRLPRPSDPADHACANGICLDKRLRTAGGGATIPPGVTQLDLNFSFGAATYNLVDTGLDGKYYTLNSVSSGETGDAIQPNFNYDSTLSGTASHGVVFMGGAYTQFGSFNPVVAVPRSTNTDGGEGPLPLKVIGMPSMVTTTGLLAFNQGGETDMVVHTGVYESASGVEDLYSDMQFTVYYSNSADKTVPTITDPGAAGFHTLSSLTASFQATVADVSSVYRALVTYNQAGSKSWKTMDLAYNSATAKWEGSINLKATTSYFVQAVDNAGNVAVLSEQGQDMSGGGQPYGSNWTGPKVYTIVVADGDGDGLPDVYEDQHPCLNKLVPNGGADPDYDYLTNVQEFQEDLDPCSGDTDGGGDNDGSERNNGRNPSSAGDDVQLTISLSKVGNDYTIAWPDALGQNAVTDGYYFVYRSSTPFFGPADKIAGPLPNGTTSHLDSNPPCGTCYYKVWDVAIQTPPPTVDAVVPGSGFAGQETQVSVYGSNFLSGATVTFGGVAATNVSFVNASKLTCKTPALGPGQVDVKVINPNGQEGVLTNGFQYQ